VALTHGRRAQVIAEIDEFIETISDDVDILLATRDVAYGFAETLGWPALRLAKPKHIDRTVNAVLNAAAAISAPAKGKDWIDVRERWVKSTLAKDSTLSETPLLPILLSLLAITKHSEALPTTRATILHEMVKAIVTRQETRQGNEFRVGALDGRSAAGALLDGFSLEAITIAVDGGQSTFERIIREVNHDLTQRWGLHPGPAGVTGEAVVRFWDETGIFVMSGAHELVAPRVELFAEIGEALHIACKPEQEVSRWADEAIKAGRLESVILAAGLSSAASRLLLQAATAHKKYELLRAAMTAVRQGAEPAEPDFTDFVTILAEEARFGDREAWQMWTAATKLPLSTSLMDRMLEALEFFPAEHQLAARTALLLRGHPEAAIDDRQAQLLDTLRLKPLAPLPRRHNGPKKVLTCHGGQSV